MAAAALSLPFSRFTSNQGSIAIKEHHRSKRRPSNGTMSASPPNMSVMQFANGSGTRIGSTPTTARGNPVATLSFALGGMGRSRPLEPTSMPTTVEADTTTAKSKSNASSPSSSSESLLLEAVVAGVVVTRPIFTSTRTATAEGEDTMVVVGKESRSRARVLLRQIFPEKLLYSDPSNDPRIFAL